MTNGVDDGRAGDTIISECYQLLTAEVVRQAVSGSLTTCPPSTSACLWNHFGGDKYRDGICHLSTATRLMREGNEVDENIDFFASSYQYVRNKLLRVLYSEYVDNSDATGTYL